MKYPLADFNITPDVAIVDPNLWKDSRETGCLHGMDALTHAIEAYVSTLNCAFTDPLALQAIEMVFDYLPASYHGNMVAKRTDALRAVPGWNGILQRFAWNRSLHGAQDRRGFLYRTYHSHGCANAMYLPYVIQI